MLSNIFSLHLLPPFLKSICLVALYYVGNSKVPRDMKAESCSAVCSVNPERLPKDAFWKSASFWLILCGSFGGRRLTEFHGQTFKGGKEDILMQLTVLNKIFLLSAFFLRVFKHFSQFFSST